MIILQTAGNSNTGGVIGTNLFDDSRDATTTFRNNTYIHQLNRALQAELRTIGAYAAMIGESSHDSRYEEGCSAHQASGKQLVRLIILNRGIPEDKAPLSIGITRQWVKVCRYLTPAIGPRTAHLTFTQLEQNLEQHYLRLIELAPLRDRGTLKELQLTAEGNRKKFSDLH